MLLCASVLCAAQVVNCQRSLMQMEAGGSLATPTWQVRSLWQAVDCLHRLLQYKRGLLRSHCQTTFS
jgi:hypothetical protein